nr:signal recognition particle-docking protein FtsY [Synechococcus sp. CBW1004]
MSSGSAAESPPPPVGAVDEAALDWARQAYARLKAQQQSQQVGSPPATPGSTAGEALSTAAQPPSPSAAAIALPASPAPGEAEAPADTSTAAPEPSPLASPVAPLPSAQSAPGSSAPVPAPSQTAAAASEPLSAGLPPQAPAAEIGLPGQPAARMQAPEAASAIAAHDNINAAASAPLSGEAPGLSLLERAAAQRQQRLKELSAVAPPPAEPAAASVPAPPPTPAAAPSPVVEESSEPTLGAFDDTFTWSAEVLAAQGRRVEEISIEEIDWLGRLRQGLEKTRRNFVSQLLENLGDDPLTPEVLDDLETTLLRADVGVQATDQVLDALRRRLNEEVVDPAEGLRFLKQQLRDLLEAPISASEAPLLVPQRGRLNIWLMVGVNGVGKTTTLGKLANLAVRSGYSCLIAAADTFRAAAVRQVQVWGERSDVPVVSNPSSNADPAAVVYDAIGAAKARGTELVLVDTAGRLQTKHNLMEELSKVRRIIDKLAPEAVIESLLVLDASQGQNGLRQAMAFASAAGLTGVVITKLDGSARGGVALAVASEAGLPIRFIGAGEGIRDLRPFNSFEFVEALLAGSR